MTGLITTHNTKAAYEVLQASNFSIPGRVGLEYYPYIVVDFIRRGAFFTKWPYETVIPITSLQELFLLPSIEAVCVYIEHLE